MSRDWLWVCLALALAWAYLDRDSYRDQLVIEARKAEIACERHKEDATRYATVLVAAANEGAFLIGEHRIQCRRRK